jgi:hypothetical protein
MSYNSEVLILHNKDDFPLDSHSPHSYNGYNNITGNREETPNNTSAEGANLEQANPDETLRQKDPVPDKLWKVPLRG